MVRLARIPADLRQRQIDAEGEVGRPQQALELGDDLAQLVGRVHEAADNAQPAGVRHGGRERGARHARHAGEQDRVLDAQQGCEGCGDGPFWCHLEVGGGEEGVENMGLWCLTGFGIVFGFVGDESR